MRAEEKATVAVSRERIQRRIEALAQMTESNRPYTRRAFTDLYVEAREWLADEFRSAGLEPRIDAGGNLIGQRKGVEKSLPALGAGSHIDTVPSGGRYDGVAGVVVALEAAQALHEAGARLRHPLWIVDFLSEEPSDYGASCVGSRALVGTLTERMLSETNEDGESLAEAIRRMGGEPDVLNEPLIGSNDLEAFLELHIEQGPVLENENVPIGVVEGIVGIYRQELRVIGTAGHAGTTPMHLRRDALVGASGVVKDIALRAREYADEEHFVATVGRFDNHPNGANVVPGEVRMTVEARAMHSDRIRRFLDETAKEAGAICTEGSLELENEQISTAEPVRCAGFIQDAYAQACKRRGHASKSMSSGAGHDAMQVAVVAPVGMIFIPCENGISHNPKENASLDDIVAGAEVMLDALLILDQRD